MKDITTEDVSDYYAAKWDTYATNGSLKLIVNPFTRHYRVFRRVEVLYVGSSLDHAVEIFNSESKESNHD